MYELYGKYKPEVETKKEILIPRNRLDEVEKKYYELQNKVHELQSDIKKYREMKSNHSGSTKEQRLQLKSINKRRDEIESQYEEQQKEVERIETIIRGMVDDFASTIDPNCRSIIPTHLSPDKTLLWIQIVSARGMFKKMKNRENESKDEIKEDQ